MRLQAEGLPDAMDTRPRHTDGARHGAKAPVRGVCGLLLQCHGDDPLNVLVLNLPTSARTRLIHQSIESSGDEPVSPPSHRLPSYTQLLCNHAVVVLFRTSQNDART